MVCGTQSSQLKKVGYIKIGCGDKGWRNYNKYLQKPRGFSSLVDRVGLAKTRFSRELCTRDRVSGYDDMTLAIRASLF
jgi:hypothetical protein